MLANFKQLLGISYKYDRYRLSGSSSSQQAATQDYTLRGDYAIFDPGLINGGFSLGVRLKENYASGSGYESRFSLGHGLFYDFRGTVLPRTHHPLSFFLNSKVEEIADVFGQQYDITTKGYGASLALENSRLPGMLNYSSYRSETDGLDIDSNSTREDLSAHLRYTLGISETFADVLFTSEEFTARRGGATAFSDSSEARLRNNLRWFAGRKARSLNSTLKFWESTGVNNRKSLHWSENLGWDLGLALRSGLSYAYNRSESEQFERRFRTGRGWLQHELYQSLTSQVDGFVNESRFVTGSEQVVGGRLALGYRKILPAASFLGASFYSQYQVTERELDNELLSIFDETHTVAFGQRLFLQNANVVPESIQVRNQDLRLHLLPYVPNVDYRVEQIGDLTEIIVVGGDLSNIIPEGTTLLVSYDILVNPDVKFAADSLGGSAQLRLRGDAYRIYGSIDRTGQHRISGRTELVALNSQTTWRMGAERKWHAFTLSSEYHNFASDTNRYHYLDGRLRYSGDWHDGHLSLFLENRNWWYDSSSGRALADRNTLRVGGKYRKVLYGSVHVSGWGDYLRAMGSVDGDQVGLGGDARWHYRQVAISLRTWAGFRRFTGNWTREEHLRFNLTRYF